MKGWMGRVRGEGEQAHRGAGRCPGESVGDSPAQWKACSGKGTCSGSNGQFTCACQGKFNGDNCEKCSLNGCPLGPEDTCERCKSCVGKRDENDGCRCNAVSFMRISPNCEKADAACDSCVKCKPPYKDSPKCVPRPPLCWDHARCLQACTCSPPCAPVLHQLAPEH
jgi:hypothetical protein